MSSNCEIEKVKQEIHKLKQELSHKEQLLHNLQQKHENVYTYNNILSTEEIVRYSRQMIMPDISVNGQEVLKNAKVLIVGIGGLGCPAALYLASAGIGEITIVDYDVVELSNLHRQVLHSEDDVDVPKVESAFNKLIRLNSNIKIIPIKDHVNSTTIERLVKTTKYDVIVDGSDNVATRYLLNDVCVLNSIPLVSGSALQMEGQLTVYHYKEGPCYRCLFPVPPPPHMVTNCGDGGVLGPVPGVIGVLEALETIKIITHSPGVLSGRFLIFDGTSCTFRNVKLRQKNIKCDVCGDNPTITALIDYEQFCGSSAHDKVIDINIVKPEQEIDIKSFNELKESSVVVDVRPELEFTMCNLPNSINYPYTKIMKNVEDFLKFLDRDVKPTKRVFILCRRGNDSQRVVAHVYGKIGGLCFNLYNVKGGLHAYSKEVDIKFPIY